MPKGPNTQLAALRRAKPAEFARKVRAAIAKAGSIPGAAEALEVSRATLFRWVSEDASIIEGLDLPPARSVARGGRATWRDKGTSEPAGGEDFAGVVAYLAPAPAGLPKLPAHLGVRIVVDRLDGGKLTAGDLAAAAAAFPRELAATRAKSAE